MIPKRKNPHTENSKNSFLTNKNTRKRNNTDDILNIDTKKGKFASPRKRKSTTDVLNDDVKRGKYESSTTEHNPRKRKSTNDIFNNVNVKKSKYDLWPIE